MIKAILVMRKNDPTGEGYYGAPRGNREHKGIDLVCFPDSIVCSPVKGKVTKHGWASSDPHKAYLRYVEITDSDDLRHRLFYVKPTAEVGKIVEQDEPVGVSQDLSVAYGGVMKNHVHYGIKTQDGTRIDPTPFALYQGEDT